MNTTQNILPYYTGNESLCYQFSNYLGSAAKRQESRRGPFGSQSGRPTSRYVVNPANSDRVINLSNDYETV